MSEFINANIQEWRRKAASGELTLEECKAIVSHIRGERVGASATSAASKERKAATKKTPVDAQGLLNELDGL